MTTTFTDARLLDGRLVDVAVTGAAISAVTPAGELHVAGEHVELDGHVLIPGLWDRHVHFAEWATTSSRVPLGAARSAHEAASMLGQYALEHPAGDLVGTGYRDALWDDQPHFALVDDAVDDADAATERRVYAISADLHAVWLNSAALKAQGFRDHPSGVLREADAFGVLTALDDVPADVGDRRVHEAAGAAAARGVVGIVDFQMGDGGVGDWTRRFARGFDELRVHAGFYPPQLDAMVAAGLPSGAPLDAGHLLTLGPLKAIIDGSLNTRTAYCFDPYPGDGGHGILTVSPDELVHLLRRATGAGLAAAVHAIGDRANALALDAFAVTGAHGSIEHAQLLREDDIARFSALGVTASVQPEHAMDDRDVAERYWAGRTGRAFPVRALLEAGGSVAFGSDAPVAPLDPWLAIASAVFRSRDGRPPWHPEQTVPLPAAVAASVRSSVAVGQPADVVVLGADPRTADVDALRVQPVAATMVAGRFSYDGIR